MQIKGIKYHFKTSPWKYNGTNGWVFISLPQETSAEIRAHFRNEEEGWGRLKAIAQIGNSEWKTAIWFDTKHKTYLLPLKAEIRKKEQIEINQLIEATIWI